MQLSKNLATVAESGTTKLTEVVSMLRAKGEQVAELSVGEPDFDTPENIKAAAIKALSEGKTKYVEVAGIRELRNAVAEKFKRDNKLSYDSSQIVICNGAKQAIYNALQAICNPGDEVILFSPFWPSLKAIVQMAGCKPVVIETDMQDIYIEEIKKKLTEKTKAIIINSPNNPTGAVYSRKQLEKLADFAVVNNVFIISDEVYEKFVYDAEHISVASLSEDVKALTVTINSCSKTYSMTGWRVGYLSACPEIVKAVNALQSHSTGNVCAVAQYAALEALNGPQDSVAAMVMEFSKRRQYVLQRLKGMLPFVVPKGAFYFFPNISGMLKEVRDSHELCEKILEEDKVALVPGAVFGAHNNLRLSYAAETKNIKKGLDVIEKRLK